MLCQIPSKFRPRRKHWPHCGSSGKWALLKRFPTRWPGSGKPARTGRCPDGIEPCCWTAIFSFTPPTPRTRKLRRWLPRREIPSQVSPRSKFMVFRVCKRLKKPPLLQTILESVERDRIWVKTVAFQEQTQPICCRFVHLITRQSVIPQKTILILSKTGWSHQNFHHDFLAPPLRVIVWLAGWLVPV